MPDMDRAYIEVRPDLADFAALEGSADRALAELDPPDGEEPDRAAEYEQARRAQVEQEQ